MNTGIEQTNQTEHPALNTGNSALPERGGRPLTRLEGVSDRQLEHINAWLKERVPYRKIVELARTEFDKTIPRMTFVRYGNRTEILRQCEALADSKATALEISRAAVTGDASFSTNTLELLEQTAFDLAAAYQRDADADDLRTLKDLWPLIHKAKATAIRQRHAAVQETKCQLRAHELALKEKLTNHRIQMDLARLKSHPNSDTSILGMRLDQEAQPSANSIPSTHNHGRGTFHPCPTSTSRDATDKNPALEADPESPNESDNKKPFVSSVPSPLCNSSSLSTSPSPSTLTSLLSFPSTLPPAVIQNNLLYHQKIEAGEIIHISIPGELARVDYSNPGDRDFFSTREQSGTARFVPDLGRTHWLPPLRSFGPPVVLNKSFPAPPVGVADNCPDSVS